MLCLRALWEMYGSATFEHPLTFGFWRLKATHVLLSLQNTSKIRIDQCMYGLHPGDDRFARYMKPTGILNVSSRDFHGARCNGKHRHEPLLGSYSVADTDGHKKCHRRSQEAGAYPRRLCPALGAHHASIVPSGR